MIQRQIRDAVQARIQAALPAVTIFRSPRGIIPESALPAVAIYSESDRATEEDSDQARVHERVYTLRTELRVAALPEDDATEDLAQALIRAVMSESDSGPMDGLVHRLTWGEQAWDGDEADSPLGGTTLDFSFHYLWRP